MVPDVDAVRRHRTGAGTRTADATMTERERSTMSDLDRDVRYRVYRHFIDTGHAPRSDALAAMLGVDVAVVRASLHRLADAHTLVLDAGSGEVWMAHPFSATATAFPVTTGGMTYWANCAWDVFGIPTLLGEDSVTVTACADCGEQLTLQVRHGVVHSNAGVVHFLVPAREFWRDIGFT